MSYPPTPQRKACDCSDPCISTDDVYYAGPNLPNSGINTYNVLTSVIEKLDAIYAVPTLQRVTEMGNYTTLPIIADSFVKIGGQPNEFLMADGSTSTGGGGDLITGNGTINRIPKFTGATTLGNSLIYDNGTNVGINTTNPGYRLEVNGDAYVETDLWVGGVFPLTVKADGGVNIDNSYGLYWYNNVSVPGALAGIGQSNDGLNFFTGASLTFPKMVISSAGLVTLPVVTNALINADATGKAVVTKEYLTTNNANFVHRAGDTMLGNLILNADPGTALQAATKQYVDNIVSGINFHPPVVVATDVSLVATYNNGLSGVGATLTGPSVGVLMIDGETPAYLDRILVWQQADPIQNGIYDLTTVGDSVTVYQLTRSSDADNSPPGEIHYGDYTLVLSGDTNGGFGFICNTPGVIDIGITPITYIQFNAAQAVTAGYGLQEVISNVIEIDPLVTQEKITLTTTGVGAATLDPLTHVLNIPTPSAETTATIGALIGSAGNATPLDTDFVATALTGGGLLKKITWANVKAFLKTYFDTIYSPNVYNILIESITTISTDTLGLYGSTLYSQNGKNVMIDNQTTNIIFQVNTTSETNFTASYTKLSASGVNITFANGTASVISPTGLFVLSGLPGSTATLTRHLDTYYLLLNNL